MATIVDQPNGFDDLPVEIVELIMLHTDTKSLIEMTQASKTFAETVENNEKLTSKLLLRLVFPSGLPRFALDILHSRRNYRRLSIVRSREQNELDDRLCQRIFAKLGRTVKDLSIDWNNSHRTREDHGMLDISTRQRAFIGELRRRQDLPLEQIIAMEQAYIQNLARRHQPSGQIAKPDEVQVEFANIFRHFGNIEKLCLQFVNFEIRQFDHVHIEEEEWDMLPYDDESDQSDDESDEERPEADWRIQYRPEQPEVNVDTQFDELRDLTTIRCDVHCFRFLASATQIQKLQVIEASWPSHDPAVNTFERFFYSQTCLKSLHIERLDMSQLFETDRSADIRFQLDSLVLKNVTMQNHHIVNAFLRSQTELKSIDFTLRNFRLDGAAANWFNNILTTISTMKKLQSLTITKKRYKLENVEFLFNISNPSVKRLIFNVTAEDKTYDIFKAFIRMFPSLEEITFEAEASDEPESGICFEHDTILDKVRTLSITNASVRSLARVTMPLLETFTYVPGKTGESIDYQLGEFFCRHRTIKNLVIGVDNCRSYFFTTLLLCQRIADFLPLLESIAIYKFEKVNMSVKLLLEVLPNFKTLKLTSADFNRISPGTRESCVKRDLKIIYEPEEGSQSPPPHNG